MGENCRFGSLNPIINFVFFIGAIVFGMLFQHPYFLIASVVLSILLLVSIKGRDSIKLLLLMIPVFLLITLINALINNYGSTILFYYFGREFTFEGLFFGIIFASMMVAMLVWFSSYNKLMTSDKFVYIFGPIIPSISLIFTLILRFIPNYQRKARQISTARACIGQESRVDVLSSLTTWAFESGITTADSMRARGYGGKRRTNYSIYRFGFKDVLILVYFVVLIVVLSFCYAKGGMSSEVVPSIAISDFSNPYTLVGLIAYILFLSFPLILNVKEALKWQILRSRI